MNDFITKIKLISNRLRCNECNSGSESMMFVVEDTICFRSLIKTPARKYPVIYTSKHLVLDKAKQLDIIKSLRVVCTVCGTSRKLGSTNITNI
jgi:hypothetical protein